MLTADLVRSRRRGDRLHLQPLKGPERADALRFARHYLRVAQASVGETRERFDEACQALRVSGRRRRIAAGLRKLVEDRCEFEVPEGTEPRALRREVFGGAGAAWRALAADEIFDRAKVLAAVAAARATSPEEVERGLYADLRTAHRLASFTGLSAEQLVSAYELAQAQAVLLRAERVTVEVRCASPARLRYLFHKLKFLRLLFAVERIDDRRHRIVIDGPYSLFAAVTKYGLQLALLLPALRQTDHFRLSAQVQWGRDRRRLRFDLQGGAGDEAAPRGAEPTVELRPEVADLLARFERRRSRWRASAGAHVLALPGVGLCVPDLVFDDPRTGARVYFEALGYWSREAVWRRADLVSAGLREKILFAVSERLRVGEEVLGDDLPAALYVYKGALSAAAVEAKLDQLAGR